MIVAIDETGSFKPGLTKRCFFIAAHLRQRKTLYKVKQRQFITWENSLPRSLKTSKGEVKSFKLSDGQLADFALSVVTSHHYVGITAIALCPADNPESVVQKHRFVHRRGIEESAKEATESEKYHIAKVYNDFGHWINKINYQLYVKIIALGHCISSSLVNTVGHSITGKYDDELTRIKFLIDKDFVREPQHSTFWHELLRNQLYYDSRTNPLPVLDRWQRKGHPFLDKYMRKGYFDFNELFWKRTSFVHSHKHFEVRIADALCTIMSRYFNRGKCVEAYSLIKPCILRNGKVYQIVLEDFNVDDWHYIKEDNPWRNLPDIILGLDHS